MGKEYYLDIIEFIDFFYADNIIATSKLRLSKTKQTQEIDKQNLKKKLNDLIELINEHFNNPPLSFDDLEVGEAYYDNLRECWFIVTEYDPTAYYQEKEICWYFDKNGVCYSENISKNEFDGNRYYRKKVK